MAKYSEEKRTRILNAAAELFATQPFHKVLLSDIATKASVGKGTLYLYFTSKDELYLSVVFREFSGLVDEIKRMLGEKQQSAREQMSIIIRELVKRIYGNYTITELLRGAVVDLNGTEDWAQKRKELRNLVESVIRFGVKTGEFKDTNPALTAQYVPGMIRSVSLFSLNNVDSTTIYEHSRDFILKGLSA